MLVLCTFEKTIPVSKTRLTPQTVSDETDVRLSSVSDEDYYDYKAPGFMCVLPIGECDHIDINQEYNSNYCCWGRQRSVVSIAYSRVTLSIIIIIVPCFVNMMPRPRIYEVLRKKNVCIFALLLT